MDITDIKLKIERLVNQYNRPIDLAFALVMEDENYHGNRPDVVEERIAIGKALQEQGVPLTDEMIHSDPESTILMYKRHVRHDPSMTEMPTEGSKVPGWAEKLGAVGAEYIDYKIQGVNETDLTGKKDPFNGKTIKSASFGRDAEDWVGDHLDLIYVDGSDETYYGYDVQSLVRRLGLMR